MKKQGLAYLIILAMVISIFPMVLVSAAAGDSANDPILIGTAAELATLAARVNGNTEPAGLYYKLTADIDLDASPYNTGVGWTPIGSITNREFRGHFDGNNKKITGLFINKTTADGGLFSRIYDGSVKNLGLEGVNVTGTTRNGGLAAYINNSNVENCYVTGTVTSTGDYTGGLVANLEKSTAKNCYTSVTVAGGTNIGGLVGTSRGNSNIENCYTTGTVTSTSLYIGGLVGYVRDNSTIKNCYSTGTITGVSEAGGIAGYLDNSANSITNCYTTGMISTSGNYAAGIVGRFVHTDSVISNCYSVAAVSGANYVGGIAGGFPNGKVISCAALNPSVKGTGSNVARVSGYDNSRSTGNVAFSGMLNNDELPTWGWVGLNNRSGEDRSAAELQLASGFPAVFSAAPWTYTPGYLPSLSSTIPVAMPEHLTIITKTAELEALLSEFDSAVMTDENGKITLTVPYTEGIRLYVATYTNGSFHTLSGLEIPIPNGNTYKFDMPATDNYKIMLLADNLKPVIKPVTYETIWNIA